MVSSFEILQAIVSAGLIVMVLIYAYATYWAFNIRRALAVRLYRNQALGIGLGSLGFTLMNMSFLVGSLNPNFIYPVLPDLVPFILFFFWIDTSVRVARRSDPLLRDVLEWRRVRIILWSLIIISIASLSLILAVIGQLTTYIPTLSGPVVEYVLFVIPIFVTFVSGAIYVTVSAVRSKDRTLRRHLLWFGLFAVCLLGAAVSYAPFGPNPVAILAFIAGGYCLYRSARSLSPLSRLSLETER
jgi:hypothetical protein